MVESTEVIRLFLLYFVMPLWFAAGFADYWCHRATYIQHTSGLKESLLHALMLSEMAVPVLLALHFEVNALVIAIMIMAFFAHELTAIWDIAFAAPRREVSAFEAHVHSYLAVLPFMLGSVTICLNWNQFLTLVGAGAEQADFSLRWKIPGLPLTYHLAILVISLITLAIPYAEEIWRCYAARPKLGLPNDQAGKVTA